MTFGTSPRLKHLLVKFLNRCLRELESEVQRMRRDPDSILQNTKFWNIEYRDSYCVSRQNSKFKDLGFTLGKVVYLQEDHDAPNTLEVHHITVVYGDTFPWGS